MTEHYCVNSCQRSHKNKSPCKACPRPVLYDTNVDAFNLFTACLTQFRYGFNGATGLDYVAVKSVAETLEIEYSESVFFKVRVMEDEYLNVMDKLRDKVKTDV